MAKLTTRYKIAGHPLLSGKYLGLKDEDQRRAHHVMAELLLALNVGDPYQDEDAEALALAVVEQVNFQLAQDLDPLINKSVSNTHPGMTTAYRDRYLSPRAWAIVERVTGVETVAFSVPGT